MCRSFESRNNQLPVITGKQEEINKVQKSSYSKDKQPKYIVKREKKCKAMSLIANIVVSLMKEKRAMFCLGKVLPRM